MHADERTQAARLVLGPRDPLVAGTSRFVIFALPRPLDRRRKELLVDRECGAAPRAAARGRPRAGPRRRRRGLRSPRLVAKSRPTAGRAGPLPLPGRVEQSSRRSTRGRPALDSNVSASASTVRRRGCCPARHSRRPRARPPSPGSRCRCTWRPVPPRPRSRVPFRARSSSAAVRSTVSPGGVTRFEQLETLPARSAGSPRPASRARPRGFARSTMHPTARNFDWTATPHWRASRSQAQME